ncbi:heme biosynthesis HemY N-terminal domain-containing protein [Noviherbaspirillum aridicola]|uniref:Heme biosynthesis protein HemY n=1 Tax=Noviherbaspirillum aridicola TaxID=2849687 RepID=A0ABQ4QA43_9BURK|nr:heme biosynthesis HemY N-terminal domain-containing protein [Noviherbaspirillum aridicola]GIZ54028.1 heme biosynthesis protein HemY [Noviherbaspirillum aridicola]
MRIFLSLVILFAAAVGLALGARFNPGNVVFFYPPYRMDMSLNLFLALAAGLFVLLFMLLSAIRRTQQMPARVAAYRREKREREGNRALRDALKALFDGRFGQAERAATRAAESPENAGLAALIAARAAHRMGQSDRRDTWLARARDEQGLKTARLMTAIELSTDAHEPEAALAAVQELNASGIRHIHALRLALKANQTAQDWPEVLRLVRLLDKRNALHPALSKRLRELAYDDLLSKQSGDAESIRRIWSTIPAEDRTQCFVAVRAARAFNAAGLHDEARVIVEKALAVEWDDRLVRVYGESAAAPGTPALLAQIERCEQWAQSRLGDAELALTLGSLCLRQQLWGRAQRQLEQALSEADEPEVVRAAHLKLAQLHESLNQPEQAAAHFRQCALATLL